MAIYHDEERNTYYVSVYVTYKNGDKDRVLRRGFKTQAEAKKKEAELIFNASISNPDNPLFSDVLEEYAEWYEKRRKASSTHKIKKDIRLYIKPFFKNKLIQDITRRDIMKFQNFLLDKLSINSSKGVHTQMSAVLRYAASMEYVSNNVAKDVGNIRGSSDKRFEYWTLSEFKEFIKIVDDLKFKTLFMLLFFSGARIGEATSLTWKDIDFKNDMIDINKTTFKSKVTDPKTKSSIRKVKMPKHTMNLLAQLKLQESPKMEYSVFGKFHDPLHVNTARGTYTRYVNKTEVKKIRMHDFRHSHASYLINNGYDIQIVSKRLGHSKVSTTLDIYSHLYPNKEDEAIAQMEDDFKVADVIKLVK